MSVSKFFVLFLLSLYSSSAEILFKGCGGLADIGNLGSKGIFPNVCIRNHAFDRLSHTWSFWKSFVENTNFTSSVFPHRPGIGLNFHGTSWRHVTFKNCTFRSYDASNDRISFDHTSFEHVLFDNCTFDSNANILFSNFAFTDVEFRDCSFHSEITLQLGTLYGVRFYQSTFGPKDGKIRNDGEGNVKLSQVSVNHLDFDNSISTGEFRIQQSSIDFLRMANSTIHTMACREKTIGGNDPELTSELNDTLLSEVTFTDGFYCDHARIRGMEIHNASVEYALDLSESDIEQIAILNVTSLTNDTCSTFDLSGATIRGKRLSNINTTKGTFAEARFLDWMYLEDFSILKTPFDVKGTIFSSEKINDECCTVSCVTRECKCDVPVEPLSCPVGDSSVNVNVEGSCFPGDATLSVIGSSGHPTEVSMDKLRYGQGVLQPDGAHGSDVFFFGHKATDIAPYIILTSTAAISGNRSTEYKLAISGEHLVPVVGRGLLPARLVQIGDVLYSEDGGDAMVEEIEFKMMRGMFAPTTLSGEMVVNGIVVSCYTEIVPAWVAHAALAPLRAVYKFGSVGRALARRVEFLHHRSLGSIVKKLQVHIAEMHVGINLGAAMYSMARTW